MKLYKQLSRFLVVSMILTSIPILASETVPTWTDTNVFQEIENGTILKEENLTKAQFAKILVNLMGYHTDNTSYIDVVGDKWYSDAVANVSSVMHQSGSMFKPLKEVTREEVAYALVNAYKLENVDTMLANEKDIDDWALSAVRTICNAGYMTVNAEGSFNPKGTITGEELIEIFKKMNAEVISRAGIYPENITGNVVVNMPGTVLKNMHINGDLYLAEGIDDGTIKMEQVVVTGRVVVEGGHIETDEKCKFNQPIEVYAKVPVSLTINGDAVDVQIGTNTTITLTGDFNDIEIGANEIITLDGATVDKITSVEVGKSPLIDIKCNSWVEKIVANTPVTIQGNGKLVELESHAKNVSSTIRPDRTTGTEKPSIPSASSVSWIGGFNDNDDDK